MQRGDEWEQQGEFCDIFGICVTTFVRKHAENNGEHRPDEHGAPEMPGESMMDEKYSVQWSGHLAPNDRKDNFILWKWKNRRGSGCSMFIEGILSPSKDM
jgi:hypothetical protein